MPTCGTLWWTPSTRVDDAPVADATAVLDDHPRVEDAVDAHNDLAAEHAPRTDDAAVTNRGARSDRSEWTNARPVAEHNIHSHYRRWVDARLRPFLGVEELEGACEREIRFRAYQQISIRKHGGVGDQDHPGRGGSSLLDIFRIVEEAQMLRPGGIQRPYAADFVVSVTYDLRAELGGQLRQREGFRHWAVLNCRITSSVMSTASSAYTSPDWNLLKIKVIPRS